MFWSGIAHSNTLGNSEIARLRNSMAGREILGKYDDNMYVMHDDMYVMYDDMYV
jgi:hypothetical protein